ncbi:MAG: c-type cytochrome [Burkholderiales bacterium]
MKTRINVRALPGRLTILTILFFSTSVAALDDSAREALMKKSNCLKCHSVEKKKDGPSFKETAGKYKDKTDAEEKLYTHLTTNPKVKIDGKEETHDMLKTKDESDIKAVITWILSR